MKGAIILLTLLLTPGFAWASSSVSLASQVFVEKAVTDDDGRTRIVLDEPKQVTPGDNLVFVLRYRNTGEEPATNFSVTNPLPKAVSFREAPGNGARFSVDGGKNWGTLNALVIHGSDGHARRARPDDVTHVRWTFRQPLPAGRAGQITFRGTVR